MPYSIQHLIEGQGPMVCVNQNDRVILALKRMIENDYSQLPVEDQNGHALGMVTYESIVRAIRSFNVKLDALHVRDCLVDAPVQYLEDDIFDLLDKLKYTNAVLILEPDHTLAGIVTSYDTTEFLRNRSEDLMRIEDIEFTIKEFLLKAYASSNGEDDQEKLSAAIARLGESRRSEQGDLHKPKTFDDLSLGEYINLFSARSTWGFFQPILQIPRDALLELLTKVRIIRNDLAHFRGTVSAQDRDQLHYCADWLTQRYQSHEKEQEQAFLNALLESHRDIKVQPALVREESPEHRASFDTVSVPGRKTVSNSRYAPLAEWLAGQATNQVSLSFEEIEGIIGTPLPVSARQHRAWWANDSVGHIHSKLWLDAGWLTTYIDLSAGQVLFSRTSGGTKG